MLFAHPNIDMKKSSNSNEFSKIGLSNREAFMHEVAVIPKMYPDSILHLLQQGFSIGEIKAGTFYQINLYTREPERFPILLFTDPNINWHGQHYGRTGLVAAAGIFVSKDMCAFVTTLQSDLCQQLYRNPILSRKCKTQVDTRYGMWYRLLVNAIVDFCFDSAIVDLYIPTATTVLNRLQNNTSPGIFTRIYDDAARWLIYSFQLFHGHEYFRVNIRSNVNQIVPLISSENMHRKEIAGLCIFHDIESSVDTNVTKEDCSAWLQKMLEVEAEHKLSLTYSVVGNQICDIKPHLDKYLVESVAFHSYDHRINSTNQLKMVRRVDHKIRGYRPPQSKITSEITDFNLSMFNFEWLLSSAGSLNAIDPVLSNYIVKIPVHLDDYQLHTGELTLSRWMERFHRLLDSGIKLVCVGLHDCYARTWIDHYPKILESTLVRRTMWNCDQIAGALLYNSSK